MHVRPYFVMFEKSNDNFLVNSDKKTKRAHIFFNIIKIYATQIFASSAPPAPLASVPYGLHRVVASQVATFLPSVAEPTSAASSTQYFMMALAASPYLTQKRISGMFSPHVLF